MTGQTSNLSTRPGRNACGRGSPAAASCLSKFAKLCFCPKGFTMENSGFQGNDREAELDSR